jgi:hypothetical protein
MENIAVQKAMGNIIDFPKISLSARAAKGITPILTPVIMRISFIILQLLCDTNVG